MLWAYKAPTFESLVKRVYELPFNIIVNASSQYTLVSSLIPFKFKVIEIKIYFSNNHNNNVAHYFLIGRNSQGSTTSIPEGENIFGQFSPANYVVGDNETMILHPNIEWLEEKGYLKVHIVNGQTYNVFIKVIIVIQEL